MTMRIYKSTDASAPSLEGVVGGAYSSGWATGSVLELLRQVLVAGYGSKTAAGWSLAFTGTSHGSFQMGGGNQRYLDILDDGSMTAGAREANCRGYGAMTALGTGTDPFPTTSQVTNGVLIRKSDTADATVRQWIVFADNKTFYLFTWTGNATAYYTGFGFGDFYSYYSGDVWNTMIMGRTTSAATDSLANESMDVVNVSSLTSQQVGHYFPRGYNQLGTSVNFGKMGNMFNANAASSTSSMGAPSSMLPYPNPEDGKLWMSRAYVADNTTPPTPNIRGFLRGFWVTQAGGANLPLEYTINGSGGLSGRTFKVLGLRSGGSANGRYVMETSDTWD